MANLKKLLKQGITPKTLSFVLFLFLIFMSGLYLVNRVDIAKADEQVSVTINYQSMIDGIQDFINENVGVLAGLNAYIQMHETYPDEEVYELLGLLLQDRLSDVRNVGVFKDTTAVWVYPREGNEGIIGVDLLQVPEQAEAVRLVMETLETFLVGPVDLVQGGQGFIIRTPIMRDGRYWGMTSVVLRVESAFDFIEDVSKETGVRYVITYNSDPDRVIYGDKKILDMKPLQFRTEHSLGSWDIYGVPVNGWKKYTWAIAAFVVSLLVAALISVNFRVWMQRYFDAIEDKAKLVSLYSRDRFTGIYTREYFNARTFEAFSESERQNYPLSMIYFDLDSFKHVNDTYGHAAGDDVLLNVVKVVNQVIRVEDVFARWGGDEFIILLPYTNLSNVAIVAERIRLAIDQMPLAEGYGVTASIGCSQWVPEEYFDSWFARTDKALYQSKASGRNAVTVDEALSRSKILYRITWRDTWACGLEDIDCEHRNMIDKINHIVEGSFSKRSNEWVLDALNDFLKDVAYHFKHEIEILGSLAYPETKEHAEIHNRLLEEAYALHDQIKRESIETLELYRYLLNELVLNHILKEDVKYYDYIR